jgi:putative nucleotidyltransferase with HDIG domain
MTRWDGGGRVGARVAPATAALGAALSAVHTLPALEESKRRVAAIASREHRTDELVAAFEADPGLTLAALRLSNRGSTRRTVASVRDAIEVLPRGSVAALAQGLPSFDYLTDEAEARAFSSFRLHAGSVQRLTETVARTTGAERVDMLVTAATLHDIGKLALQLVRPDVSEEVAVARGSPSQRVGAERATLGFDHAELGGAIARHWQLPDQLCAAIEGHHDEEPLGPAAIIATADLLTHFGTGDPIELHALTNAAERSGLDTERLGALLYELPHSSLVTPQSRERCPLSDRELQVMCGVRDGKVAKQIAQELGLAESTIRSHLHRIYSRLEVLDRAQAVLVATERGWLCAVLASASLIPAAGAAL